MFRKLSAVAALVAGVAVFAPSPANAQGPAGPHINPAAPRALENLRLSTLRDFYDRVGSVDDRSAGAGLFAMPASNRFMPRLQVYTPLPERVTSVLPGMDAMMKSMKKPFSVSPWFFDFGTGFGVTFRGQI